MAQAVDFFVSYTSNDRAWAEWVAWQLEQAGYRVIIQAWDFEPGDNFVDRMRDALEQADRTLALVSAAYLASPYCTNEWTGAFLHDPDGRNRLLQVRIEDCEMSRLLRAQVYVDLVGLPREQAKARLLAEVKRGRRKPTSEPSFPHDQRAGPRFPGHGLEITNLPPRNPAFSGRAALLEELHKTQTGGGQAAAVHGLGGVGKTQLALEYAHRYAADYDVIWWVPAEQPVAIPGLLTGLAKRLGIPELADQAELLASLWDELRRRDRWLLIYDNAPGPRDLAPYRPPGGPGRVLVTSRMPTWDRGTATVRLDVLNRDEAVAFLRRRTGSDDTSMAALAEALGDLPLALEQAAAYMDETHTSPARYLALYREHGAELLTHGEPLTTEQTVTTTWQVALDRLSTTTGAQELLGLCAFLAPDDIPRGLLGEHADVLPQPLHTTIGRPLAYNQAISTLGRFSLATVTEDSLEVHRLVQTVVRATLGIEDEKAWATLAIRLLSAGFPNPADEPANWRECQRLLPHVLAVAGHGQRLDVELAGWTSLYNRAAHYLWSRGRHQEAVTLLKEILVTRRRVLGDDHPDTLNVMNNLAVSLENLGDLEGANDLQQRLLTARRRVLGTDHPDTLTSMNNLAVTRQKLGDLQGAHDLYEDAVAGLRRALGEDHPDTLISMTNLAQTRLALGDLDGAHDLHQQALAGLRRVLGDDHWRTLVSINNLAEARRALGDFHGAHDLHQQALSGLQRVLGDEHQSTLTSMNNLAETRRALGDLDGAHDLHQRALAARRQAFGEDNLDTLQSMNNLAQTLRELGDLHGAYSLHEQALAAYRRVLGDDHPSTLMSMNNLAEVKREVEGP